MGPYFLMDVGITVDPRLSASAVTQTTEHVRRCILMAHPQISEVLVYVKVDSRPLKEEKEDAERLEKMNSFDDGCDGSDVIGNGTDIFFGSPSSSRRRGPIDKKRQRASQGGEKSDALPSSTPNDRDDVATTTPSIDIEHGTPTLERTPPSSLTRSTKEVERDVRHILVHEDFLFIRGFTHFTCHFTELGLEVQLEVVMDSSLTIWQAQNIADILRKEIVRQVDDVVWADIHLELCRSDITKNMMSIEEIKAAPAFKETKRTPTRRYQHLGGASLSTP